MPLLTDLSDLSSFMKKVPFWVALWDYLHPSLLPSQADTDMVKPPRENHRIIKGGKDCQDHGVQPLTEHHHQLSPSTECHIQSFIEPFHKGDSTTSTTSLGSLFQCLTTLSVKRFFPISNLNLPCCRLRLSFCLLPGRGICGVMEYFVLVLS